MLFAQNLVSFENIDSLSILEAIALLFAQILASFENIDFLSILEAIALLFAQFLASFENIDFLSILEAIAFYFLTNFWHLLRILFLFNFRGYSLAFCPTSGIF